MTDTDCLLQKVRAAGNALARERGQKLTDVFADTLEGDLARLEVLRRLRRELPAETTQGLSWAIEEELSLTASVFEVPVAKRIVRTATDSAAFQKELLAVCKPRGVLPEAVLGDGKTKAVANARIALYVRLADVGWSPTEIARAIGRNHSSVSHGIRRGRGIPRVRRAA